MIHSHEVRSIGHLEAAFSNSHAHRRAVRVILLLMLFGRNKTLGVIGYGDIGQSCARMARVFGMRILALRRRTDLSESERESGLKVTSARSLPCAVIATLR